MTINYRRFEAQRPIAGLPPFPRLCLGLYVAKRHRLLRKTVTISTNISNSRKAFTCTSKRTRLKTGLQKMCPRIMAGQLLGWARSIERDDHLELTHFFVDTNTQGSGVGHELLDLAFPVHRGKQRSIIATTNPRALSLYLRYDVSFQGMAFSIYGEPQDRGA